ncbi:MAG TPA: hypothetical protein PLV59_03190 [Candidatus Dojkabacteria bacterium]|nr:hypothetical protein [Candidatus Dojkabacteria bacterium]
MPENSATALPEIIPEVLARIEANETYHAQMFELLLHDEILHPFFSPSTPGYSFSTIYPTLRNKQVYSNEEIAHLLEYPELARNHADAHLFTDQPLEILDALDAEKSVRSIGFESFFFDRSHQIRHPDLFNEFCYVVGTIVNVGRSKPLPLSSLELIRLGCDCILSGSGIPLQPPEDRVVLYDENSHTFENSLNGFSIGNRRRLTEDNENVEDVKFVGFRTGSLHSLTDAKIPRGARNHPLVRPKVLFGSKDGEFLERIDPKVRQVTNLETFHPKSFTELVQWWTQNPSYFSFTTDRHRPSTYINMLDTRYVWKDINSVLPKDLDKKSAINTAVHIVDMFNTVLDGKPVETLVPRIVGDRGVLDAYRKLESYRIDIVRKAFSTVTGMDFRIVAEYLVDNLAGNPEELSAFIKDLGFYSDDEQALLSLQKDKMVETIKKKLEYLISEGEMFNEDRINRIDKYLTVDQKDGLKNLLFDRILKCTPELTQNDMDSLYLSLSKRSTLPPYLSLFVRDRTSKEYKFHFTVFKYLVENGKWPSFWDRSDASSKANVIELESTIESQLKSSSDHAYVIKTVDEIINYCQRHKDIKLFKDVLEDFDIFQNDILTLQNLEKLSNPNIQNIWKWLLYSHFLENCIKRFVEPYDDILLTQIAKEQWKELAATYGYKVFVPTYNYAFKDISAVGRYRAQVVFNEMFDNWVRNGLVSEKEYVEASPVATEVEASVKLSGNLKIDEVTSELLSLKEFLKGIIKDSGIFEEKSVDTILSEIASQILNGLLPYKRSDMIKSLKSINNYRDTAADPYGDANVVGEILLGKHPSIESSLDFLTDLLSSMERSVVKDLINSSGAWDVFFASSSGSLLSAAIANRNLYYDKVNTTAFTEILTRVVVLYSMKAWSDSAQSYARLNSNEIKWSRPKVQDKGSNLQVTNLAPFHIVERGRKEESHLESIGLSSILLQPGIPEIFIGGAGAGKTTLMRSLALQLYLASLGVPGYYEGLEGCKVGKVIVSLNSDQSNEMGSRFKNMVRRVSHIIDDVIEFKNTNPGEKVLICMDELFRGSDDVNAVALYAKIVENFYEDPDVFFITSTHYMLLKDACEKGFAPSVKFSSFDSVSHEITSDYRESDIKDVLIKMGFPNSFIDSFINILNGDMQIHEKSIAAEIKDLPQDTQSTLIGYLLDLGVIGLSQHHSPSKYYYKEGLHLNADPEIFYEWMNLEKCSDELYKKIIEYRLEAYSNLGKHDAYNFLNPLSEVLIKPTLREHERGFFAALQSLRVYFETAPKGPFTEFSSIFMKEYEKDKDVDEIYRQIVEGLLAFYSKHTESDGFFSRAIMLNRERYGFEVVNLQNVAKLFTHTITDLKILSQLSRYLNEEHDNLCFVDFSDSSPDLSFNECFYPGQGAVAYSRGMLNTENTVRNTLSINSKGTAFVGDNSSGKTVTAKMISYLTFVGYNLGIGYGKKITLPSKRHSVRSIFSVESSDFLSSSMDESKKILVILKEILSGSKDNYLVVFDELGATVSSKEGSVLAALVVYLLVKKGHKVLVTTHYHQLFHILNQLGLDIDSYGFVYNSNEKTHYKAQHGLKPGTSRGVERSIDFVNEMKSELKNPSAILKIFEAALDTRPNIAKLIN